jgi:hypothetical protein
MTDASRGVHSPLEEMPQIGSVPLSPVRQHYLAPRLRALIFDFRKLEEVEITRVEPGTAFRIERWNEDDQ